MSEELEDRALAVINKVIDGVLDGTVPVRNGREASEILSALYRVMRLEKGQVAELTGHVAFDLSRLHELVDGLRVAEDRHDRLPPADRPRKVVALERNPTVEVTDTWDERTG